MGQCGPPGQSLSRFLQHEATRSISTAPWMGCQSIAGLPPSIKFNGTHLFTWVERGTVRVKCLSQEHNTMSPASARTRTAHCCSRKYPYPSHGRFFKLNPPPTPPEIPFQCHTFVKKIGLLKSPSPLEFPLTFLGVGMDIFWNRGTTQYTSDI